MSHFRIPFVAALLALSADSVCAAPAEAGLINLPIEQLMEFEVESASKRSQKVAQAPAVVSIVTAQDISTFGYRTLADVLNSIRGLYVSYDRNYSYLGVRGFSTAGDYNTRVLLLIDGIRYNDSVYHQASIGTELGIDIDMIERVEFISGPTSAVYGSNAVFGVINVVTKSGSDYKGGSVAAESGSYGARKGRVAIGDADAKGAGWLVSVGGYRQRGENLYYQEFDTPEQNYGVACHADDEVGTTVFAKYQRQDFMATLSYGERTKGTPTASYEQRFNDDRSDVDDRHGNLGLEYRHAFSAERNFLSRLYGGYYSYRGNYVYDGDDPPLLINRDESEARWYGGELQFTDDSIAGHHLALGLEYRSDQRIEQRNFDVDPYLLALDDRRSEETVGFYLQDELRLGEHWLLHLGLRLDHLPVIDGVATPRAGLVYERGSTVVKLLYGTAYRSPNPYELYYLVGLPPGFSFEAPKEEKLESSELIIEHELSGSQRLSFSAFHNVVDDLIIYQSTEDSGLIFVNGEGAHTHGAELEWQAIWYSGLRIKASYSWQQTRDTANDRTLVNAPRNLVKLNLSGPLRWQGLSYGIDIRGVSKRKTLRAETSGYVVTDLTLRAELGQRWDLSASCYNLFDQRYYDPGSSQHRQDEIMQNGRNYRVRLEYWF